MVEAAATPGAPNVQRSRCEVKAGRKYTRTLDSRQRRRRPETAICVRLGPVIQLRRTSILLADWLAHSGSSWLIRRSNE